MESLVGFSGGKDSLGSALWAKENLKKFKVVFNDVGWESQLTYDYINYVQDTLQLDMVILRSAKFDGFIEMVKSKGRFPSTKSRFCTVLLKTEPMIDYVLSLQTDCYIVQGIRADESASRSKMSAECRYFKYYLEPFGTDKNGKEKFHSYRKGEVLDFVKKYDDSIIRPMFDFTAEQVFEYCLKRGVRPNPLYDKGFGRVGCFPCVMTNHTEMLAFIKYFISRLEELAVFEKEIDSTFFPPDYIPERYCTKRVWIRKYSDEMSDPEYAYYKEGGNIHTDDDGEYCQILKKCPTIPDVIKYLTRNASQIDLFTGSKLDLHSCENIYTQCE